MITTAQKWLLGGGALLALLVYKSRTASAATSVPNVDGSSSGGGLSAPPAGNGLLVTTQDTGAAGRLNIRTNPGTNYPEVALANHGDTLISLGNAQTASDGTVWWNVKTGGGTSGWAESNYLQDMGPGGVATSGAGTSGSSGVTPLPADMPQGINV